MEYRDEMTGNIEFYKTIWTDPKTFEEDDWARINSDVAGADDFNYYWES